MLQNTSSSSLWSDPKFVTEIEQRLDEIDKGKVKGYAWNEVQNNIRQKGKASNS